MFGISKWFIEQPEVAILTTSHSTCSFIRIVNGTDISFDMEKKLSKLHNLAGHVIECKGNKHDNKKDEPTSEERINIKQSAKIMKLFLKEGELNPKVIAIYKGFLCIFSACLIDESLPWSTGEVLLRPLLIFGAHATYLLLVSSDYRLCVLLARFSALPDFSQT